MEYDVPPWGGLMKVPLLVVEYVETSLWVDDGAERHREHLMMAMASVESFLKSLNIAKTLPAYGLLVDGSEATLFGAWDTSNAFMVRIKSL